MSPQTIYLLVLDRMVTVADFNRFIDENPVEHLNERGIEQIKAIVPRIASYDLSRLYVSPLLRAQQTAQILIDALGLPKSTHPGLTEILPAPLHDAPEKIMTYKRAYIRSGLRLVSPRTNDAENAFKAFRRIRRAWIDLTTQDTSNFGIVGHQGIFRLLFLWIHLSPGWRLVHGDTRNAGITVITRRL